MSRCNHCGSDTCSVVCANCKKVAYCDAVCAESAWNDQHYARCGFEIWQDRITFMSKLINMSTRLKPFLEEMNMNNERVRRLLQWVNEDPSILQTFREHFNIVKLFHTPNVLFVLLTEACVYGYIRIVRVFLEDGRVDPRMQAQAPFNAAAYNGHVEIIRALLQDGRSDPAYRNNMAVSVATQRGHDDVLRVLVNHPRVTVSVDDAMRFRVMKGNTDMTRRFWTQYIEQQQERPNDNNNTEFDKDATQALMTAADNGQRELVRDLLINGKAYPNAKNRYALRRASANGKTGIVGVILADSRVKLTEAEALQFRDAKPADSKMWRLWDDYIREKRKANVKKAGGESEVKKIKPF